MYKKNKRKRLEKELNAGFDIYLEKKYQLTARNLEFWKSWITKSTQKEVAEELFISIDAIKSYGLLKGIYMSLKRILSCHPIKLLGGGEGFDPVVKRTKVKK